MKLKDEVNIKGKYLHQLGKSIKGKVSLGKSQISKNTFSPNHHAHHHQQMKDVTKHLKDRLLPSPTALLIGLDALSQVDSLRLPDLQTHPEHACLS